LLIRCTWYNVQQLRVDSDGYITAEPAASLKAEVEDLFYKYKVDTYWSGHEHSYERQYPVYQTTTVEQAYSGEFVGCAA
jgi:hypothetical protein